MSDDKKKIPIDQVSPGMRLAEPIRNSSGVTLMPAGTRLAPMFIDRLKKWYVSEVTVAVEDKSGSTTHLRSGSTSTSISGRYPTRTVTSMDGKETDEFSLGIIRDLNRRFANVQDNPLMVILRDIAARKLIALGPDSFLNLVHQIAPDEEDEG